MVAPTAPPTSRGDAGIRCMFASVSAYGKLSVVTCAAGSLCSRAREPAIRSHLTVLLLVSFVKVK